MDPGGRITFTHHGCPTDQQQQLQNAFNATPGNDRPIPMASEITDRTSRTTEQNNPQEPTIVGQQDDGCGNRITGRERREAMIKKEVRPGMTRRDVESALGKPDRISSRNDRTSYHYRDNEGNTRQIGFDQHNCVSTKDRK
ncbi:outer membrane protein assembly factor BamE [Azotobacter armeniacus]